MRRAQRYANGEYSLANLEAIVRWKSERVVHYLIGNSEAKIKKVLAVAAAPDSSTGRLSKLCWSCAASIWRSLRPFLRRSRRSATTFWTFAL